jgi:hypothetical protein
VLTAYIVKSRSMRDYQAQKRLVLEKCRSMGDFDCIEETKTNDAKHKMFLRQIIKNHTENDTIVIEKIDRISGDHKDFINFYVKCASKGIHLEFISEPWFNLTDETIDLLSYRSHTEDVDEAAGLFWKYLSSSADRYLSWENENTEKRHLERSRKMQIAKANGSVFGVRRGSKLTTSKGNICKEYILKYSKSFEGDKTDKELMRMLPINVCRNTYYKYKRHLYAERKSEKKQKV